MASSPKRGRILVVLALALAALVPCGADAYAARVCQDVWYDGLSISDSSILVGESVTLDASVSGEDVDGVRYNYGWRRDGSWDKGSWSTSLQNGSGLQSSPEWTFKPPVAGTYEVFVDVVRPDGIAVGTKVVSLSVDRGWTIPSELSLSATSPQNTGTKIVMSAPATGTRADRVEYRYSWTRDNGADSFATSYVSDKSYAFTPTHSGDYTLSVDIRDKDTGQVVTLKKNFRVNRGWELTGLDLSYSKPLRPGTKVTWTARVSGNTQGLKYNFVWERDNWAEWGSTARSGDWATTNSKTYTIGGSGRYSFYVDVEDQYGEKETVSVTGVRGFSASDARDRVISVARGELNPYESGYKYENALTAAGGTLCNYRHGWWCVNFLWWCFREADQQDIYGTSGMAVEPDYLANEFKSLGAFNGSSGLQGIKVGDIAFSLYNAWRPGQTIGHGALVVGVTDTTVTVIEGNGVGGGVRTNTWSRWESRWRGYARPAY